MDTKKCFKCGVTKSLDDFYAHPQMADGHLNKCVKCTKKDVLNDYKIKSKNPDWIEKERARGREKAKRLKFKINPDTRKEANERWKIKYPEKIQAHYSCSNLKPPVIGMEKHHWSYNEDHYQDVIWLSKSDHMKAHRFIVYDQERMMYRKLDLELLDNKKDHELYIKEMILIKPN